MVDAVRQGAGHLHGIRPHPEEMAGVQIHPQNVVPHLTPQAAERLHIVHQLPAMELQGDALHPVVPGPGGQRLPHRDGRLPLVAEDFLRLRRPGRDDPGGSTVLRAAARAGRSSSPRSPPPAAPPGGTCPPPPPLSPAPFSPGNRGLPEQFRAEIVRPVFPQSIQQPVPGTGVRRQPFQVHMGRRGPVAAAQLHLLQPQSRADGRCLCQGAVCQAVRHQAEFHVDSSSVFVLDTLMIPEPLPRRNPELMLDGGGLGCMVIRGKFPPYSDKRRSSHGMLLLR